MQQQNQISMLSRVQRCVQSEVVARSAAALRATVRRGGGARRGHWLARSLDMWLELATLIQAACTGTGCVSAPVGNELEALARASWGLIQANTIPQMKSFKVLPNWRWFNVIMRKYRSKLLLFNVCLKYILLMHDAIYETHEGVHSGQVTNLRLWQTQTKQGWVRPVPAYW